MSTSIESVACIANTPAQAMLFVATLKAEGIPARIEGENLTDEWAASRRLLNLLGTRVMVPTNSVARARELLQPAEVDADELERQALAAPFEDAAPRDVFDAARPEVAKGLPWLLLALLALVGGVVALLVFGPRF